MIRLDPVFVWIWFSWVFVNEAVEEFVEFMMVCEGMAEVCFKTNELFNQQFCLILEFIGLLLAFFVVDYVLWRLFR